MRHVADCHLLLAGDGKHRMGLFQAHGHRHRRRLGPFKGRPRPRPGGGEAGGQVGPRGRRRRRPPRRSGADFAAAARGPRVQAAGDCEHVLEHGHGRVRRQRRVLGRRRRRRHRHRPRTHDADAEFGKRRMGLCQGGQAARDVAGLRPTLLYLCGGGGAARRRLQLAGAGQHGVGLRHGRRARRGFAGSDLRQCGAARAALHDAEFGEHGLGLRHGGPRGAAVLRRRGGPGGAPRRRVQHAGAGQHGLGLRDRGRRGQGRLRRSRRLGAAETAAVFQPGHHQFSLGLCKGRGRERRLPEAARVFCRAGYRSGQAGAPAWHAVAGHRKRRVGVRHGGPLRAGAV
mmetsp:Transcript_6318/g.22373  ORF Transcript_6318/g.22373 Transcript_6318/m.22373 type:complete len:343 (-) Transcript_6318:3776-4804(-)